jgi:hypothetical protein
MYLSIPRASMLTGFPLRDGSRCYHTSYEDAYYRLPTAGFSVERRDRHHSSPLHTHMKKEGVRFFKELGFRVFPRQIGLWAYQNKMWRMCDLAVEKRRKLVLVECLTPWSTDQETIKKKLELETVAPVYFIGSLGAAREFRQAGFFRGEELSRFEQERIYIYKRRT